MPPRAALVLLALAGAAVVLAGTRWGVGISPDSVTYVGAARSLLAGLGLTEPSADGPQPVRLAAPLYPVVLALIGLTGIDPLRGARWLNVLLFAVAIYLTGRLVERYTGGARSPALLAACLVLLSVDMLNIFLMAWTEPLFIVLVLLAAGALARHMEDHRGLMTAGLIVALAVLLRYPGAALVPAGVVAIVFTAGRRLLVKLRDLAVFTVIGCLPAALWIATNLRTRGTATGYVRAQPGQLEPMRIDTMFNAMSAWLVPERIPGVPEAARAVLLVLAIAAIAALTLALARRLVRSGGEAPGGNLPHLPVLLGIFAVSHAGFFILTTRIFRFGGALGGRYQAPVFVSLLIIGVCLGYRALNSGRRRPSLAVATIALTAALVASYAARAAVRLAHSYRDGLGYAGRQWQQSEVIEHLRQLPAATHIYSNGPDAVYILTGRLARYTPTTSQPEAWTLMRQRLASGHAVIADFSPITWRQTVPSAASLATLLPIVPAVDSSVGTLYVKK